MPIGIVRYLAEYGADINKADEDGETPLDIASYEGNLDIVCYLVESGADIHKADEYGNTYLHK